jgi:hypothetical protein
VKLGRMQMMHSYGLLDSTLVIGAILQTAAYSIALMIVGCVGSCWNW